jgi:hypothetical protein
MRIDRTTAMRLFALITGATYVTLCYRVPELIQMEPLWHVLLAFAVLLPVTFIFAAFSDKDSWVAPFFLVIGVGIGVIADAFSDRVSRNLFPFEFVWWLVLFAPAIVAGISLDWLVRKYKLKSMSNK